MFIDDSTYNSKGKTYRRVLLRNSYRVNGVVKHDTIANLSNCSVDDVAHLKKSLKLAKKDFLQEDSSFKKKYKERLPSFYLYDVTSSYLEGTQNELGEFGYNRDGKKGKQQIVIGLMTDAEGWALALQL